jgi:hypothetical protein
MYKAFCRINPTIKNFPQHYDKGEHIPRVNAMLKANAAIMGYTYINLHPLFVDAQNRLDANTPTKACT